jgi:hypothetical protein
MQLLKARTHSEMVAQVRVPILIALVCAVMIWAPAPARADRPASTPFTGQFSFEDHIGGLEPESSLCGFRIDADIVGQGTFQVFFDDQGEPARVHVLVHSTSTLSANGLTLRGVSSNNRFHDFGAETIVEVGLVFSNYGPGVGVVLMDRGRLVWTMDPGTGEMVGAPLFEAGPHPQLHGDLGDLCSALTP